MAPSPGAEASLEGISCGGGDRRTLTEEQRQAIIAKLLSERRSRVSSSGGGSSSAASTAAARVSDAERSERVQQLIQQRLAARQHQHQQHQTDGPLHGAGHAHLPRFQGHHQHHQHLRRRSSATDGGGLSQQSSREALLSPGSACSLASNAPLAPTYQPPLQQQQQSFKQQPQQWPAAQPAAKRQSSISAALGSPPHAGSSGPLPAVPQPPAAANQQPPQQQEQAQRRLQPASFLLHQQQHGGLDAVLDGPVDISDLWGGLGGAGAGASYTDGLGSELSSSGMSAITEEPSGASDAAGHHRLLGRGGGGSRAASSTGLSALAQLAGEPGSDERLMRLLEGGLGDEDDIDDDGLLLGSSARGARDGPGASPQLRWGQHQPPPHQAHQQQQQQPLLQRQQHPPQQQHTTEQRMQHLHTLHRQLSEQRSKQQQQQPGAQQQQQQQQQSEAPGRRRGALPRQYPATREERLQQLAQPKAANREKYEQMKLEAEQEQMQKCSFAPKTGRGPQHRFAPKGLSAAERLFQSAADKAARMERKAAELAGADLEGCTFAPRTNRGANARVLERYEYVPLHQRLGQVVRSRSEKLAAIQQAVEAEQSAVATFAPAINPRSAALASLRRSRSCSRQRTADARAAGSGGWSPSPSPPPRDEGSDDEYADEYGGDDVGRSAERGRSRSRQQQEQQPRGLRRTWSETDLSAGRRSKAAAAAASDQHAACTFTPRINSNSQALLQSSGEIPRSFLERQQYFDRLAREKKQLLQLAVEDQHCSFTPGTRSSSRSGWSDRGPGSSDQQQQQQPFLDRLERLAYQDARRSELTRSTLAERLHATECTFAPAINPRSARMARATPLQELYENSKGRQRREAVAMAVEAAAEAECSFVPNLSKPGSWREAPADAKLSLSAEHAAAVFDRLYTADTAAARAQRGGEGGGAAQYAELAACTFKPAINKTPRPRSMSPVPVRGLGRFLELKDMARQAAEERAATEARVFLTAPRQPASPFTIPQPFQLGRRGPSGHEARKQRAEAEAEAAAMAECTFAPRINSSHKSRQQRVAELLAADDAQQGGR